ncbi:MAG: hypothetical protein HY707_04305 [Ignavibacteriae bacterium]|nr:hypothetical protein [Ignavibacteriota bacterium]
MYDLSQRRLLEQFSKSIRVESRFISYGIYVLIYYTQTKNTWSSKIYEAKIQNSTNQPYWSSEGGNTASASVSSVTGQILYEVRNDSIEVYLKSQREKEARFTTSGLGARWSPNGRWFLVSRQPTGYRGKPKERFLKGKITKEEFEKEIKERRDQKPWKWPLTIFDSTGNEVLRLEEFNEIGYWSSTSNRFLYDESGGKGFSILELELSATKPHMKSVFHYDGPNVPAREGWFEEISLPSGNQWSPDGMDIIFIRGESEGHTVQNYSIWIFNIIEKTAYELTKRLESFVEAMWAVDGGILVHADSKIIKLELEEFK